ncbi:BgTH12-02989 [Blumeria graminis f. sp. triticale]|uniref:Bgt-51084 n=2 Tax=Blumeria graminis TaxID=34373 RepID=A0A9X9MIU3_BLUGR|nr:BgTH12-02989 [Blumeria graminis f. sp. triticale]VDB89347.1 Bgt-51084 [Blumeria graminis f. sp. tritici]
MVNLRPPRTFWNVESKLLEPLRFFHLSAIQQNSCQAPGKEDSARKSSLPCLSSKLQPVPGIPPTEANNDNSLARFGAACQKYMQSKT